MHKPSRVEVAGPLAAFAVGFRRELAGRGYSRSRATGLLLLMARLSRWLAERGREAGELSDVDLEQFVSHRRVVSRDDRQLTARAMTPLLEYLRGLGVVPRPVPVVALTPREQLLDAFVAYLAAERGLADSTIGNYRSVAARFLVTGSDWLDGIAGLCAEQVSAFVLAEAARCSAGSLNNVTTGLRALLRWLHVEGHTPMSLVGAVPAAPGWRDDGLPRAVAADQIGRLLASCDRRTNVGRRDLAMLTVLARLGLRAGEVAALNVDDLDWRAGEIEVRGKGNRRERLPLPVDVGRAIAEYCRRGRRRGACRSLFLHAHAPYVGLSHTGVNQVVARACERAGLSRVGAHRLRHSAACAMRAAGAPLLEIGQALRHRDVSVTAHYARDDQAALHAVARPWPGGAA
ncbi:site-specific integrase [Dactylosporangium sp. NBC_01737]|uniref:tyrosine-type recombinase/integrase n=1 Tax=Dactylosporangium sp. NBC_01737 TaxID=2975959 RepID=UPI002E1391B6|nr:site-specific integrase [Dactylosporangium sp. NBC_01737]